MLQKMSITLPIFLALFFHPTSSDLIRTDKLTSSGLIRTGLITFSDYFIVGLPWYKDSQVHLYVSTLNLEPFQVDITVLKFESQELGTKKIRSNISVAKFELAVYTVEVKKRLTGHIRHPCSVVFKSQQTSHVFSLTAVFIDQTTGSWIDSILATPVSMFHRRFYMPGFPKTEFQIYIVSASDQNYVEVRIGRTTSDTFLNSGRAAYFSFCEIADVYNRFGAFVHADDPVGVMITSCHQETMFDCDHEELGFVASAILPPILDCEFIVFSRLNPLLDPQHEAHDELRIMNSDSYFVIITINDETELFLDGPYYMLTLKIQNDRPLHLHANLPVVCYYVSKSKDCTWGMSSSLILPNELFIFSYAISVPFPYNSSRSAGTAFLIFVVTDDQFPMILMDEIYLMHFNTTVTKVDGTKKYQVRYLQISTGLHYSYSEDVSNYGLYLFGRKDFGTYFHPVGFYDTSREDRPEDVEYGPMFPGDLVDNDEDGSVDEELLDKDVDHDNQNSEDLRRETAVHGRWGQWNTWACQDMCSLSYFERRRTCSRPSPLFEGSQCQGHDLEVKDTACGGQQCDTVLCPDGYYGINCELQCQNCGGDCNKRDGSCQFCKPGWIGLYCHVACPPMTYGFECQHSCSQKCNGKDCIDRVYGYCHQAVDVKAIMITYYVVIFVVLCGLLYLIFYNKKKNDEPLEIITVKRVSSKEFVLNTRKFN